MNLYLLRHASAGLRRANPKIDAHRPLDKDGKQFCIQLGQTLGLLKVQFDLVVSSPLKRSLQTAALVGTETGYETKIMVSAALAPGGTLPDFQKLLAELVSRDNVLLVGHNPSLTGFLGSLIASGGGLAFPQGTSLNGASPAHGASANGASSQVAGRSAAASNGAGHAARAASRVPSPPAAVRLRKGSLARVNCDSHPPSLQWLLDPRIVRALYASSTTSSRRKTSRK